MSLLAIQRPADSDHASPSFRPQPDQIRVVPAVRLVTHPGDPTTLEGGPPGRVAVRTDVSGQRAR